MSFWRKLFYRGAPERPANEREQIDRAPRLILTNLQKIEFWPNNSSTAIHLFNISETGVGLNRRDFQSEVPGVGQILEGRLHFGTTSLGVSMEIRHKTESIIGCRFIGSLDLLTNQIKNYLNFELEGLRIKPVNPEFLKIIPGIRQVWFTDGRHNEVYVSLRESHIEHFHMTFLGHYVEGGVDSIVRFGLVVESGMAERNMMFKGSNLIRFDDDSRNRMQPYALRFLSAVQGLDTELRDSLAKLLAL